MTDDMPAGAGEEPGPRFPLRLAAIDIGSNAIRFVAVEFTDASSYTILESRRAAIRLGHAVFLTGRIATRLLDDTIATLADFRRRMDTHGVAAYRAVATSAIRDSGNAAAFRQRARAEAGVRVDVISGAEEARLVWLAVRDRVHLDGPWLLVDLGGGSLELSVVTQAAIACTESHALGTVRLLAQVDDGTGQDDDRLAEVLATQLAPIRLPACAAGELQGLLATGGNAEAIATLAAAAAGDSGVIRLTVHALHEVNRRLAALTREERVSQLGLRPDRADVILPAGLVYAHLARLAGAAEILVPHVGVREGVLLDLASR
jgi:exopolyphosphatase / guanosine-5'-triphosphate,3'-diphosphate pyrophosphatase